MRERTHRLPREAYRGQVTASITMCVKNRVPLFTEAEAVAPFIDMLQYAAKRKSCTVILYCFMPDHLHLVIRGNSPEADLWKMLVDFKQASGFWLSRNRPNVSWQKDFFDHVLRRDEDLVSLVRYILDNPCRKGLVANWEDYAWKGSLGCQLEDVLAGVLM